MDTNKPETPKPTITREEFDAAVRRLAWEERTAEDELDILAYADQQDARIAELELVCKFERSGHDIGVKLSRACADAIKSAESTGYGMAMQAAKEHYAGKMSKTVAEKVKAALRKILVPDGIYGPSVYAIIDSMTEESR